MDLVSHEQIGSHGVMRKRKRIQTSGSDRPPAESEQLGLDPNVPLPGQCNTPDTELITDWNQTAADYPRDKRIHDFIEEQVARSPDAVAAIFRDQQLTYRELDSRANQMARFLMESGVRPEARIGIACDRSLNMLVALLGVLKAGGTYVPLDPFYPADRTKDVIADAVLAFVLTEEDLRPTVSKFGAPIIAMDTEWPVVTSHRSDPLRLDFSSENLAYIIFTSGSTGRPKGVMVRHRNVANLFIAMDQHLPLETPGVWLAVTSISFDISVLELLWTLARGFRVIVQERNDGLLSPPSRLHTGHGARVGYSIPEQILRHRVTHLQCTPSLARMIVNSPAGRESLGTLDKLLVGGEALPISLANELHRAGPKEIWNMYGPTETTVWSTMQKLHRDDRVISIGRPIANTWILVLDEEQKPVPVGVPGELYISGAGVAQGYLNDPDLTAKRFVETGWWVRDGRAYRTGDLVRRLPDGGLEFLGRLDHQVKIRGYRVELGEVETALSLHAGIREAIVSAAGDPDHGHTLVAYVTKSNEDLSAADLRRSLQAKLPSHMVPSSFVFLHAFPLTPNGKIDRRALSSVRPLEDQVAVSAADEIEEKLADLWCYALGLTSIDMNGDYFEMGGDSLAAVRLICEINLEFRTQLPLGTLLEAPTIRKMAETIRGSGISGVDSAIAPIQRDGSKPPLYCIGPLNGEVLLYRKLALELGRDQPMYGLQPFGLNSSALSVLPVESIASYYIDQIKTRERQPYALLGYSFGGLVAVEMAQQLSKSGGFVPRVVLIDAEYPAGCKAEERFEESLRRYRFHLRKVAFGPNRFGHAVDRLKERWVRTAHRIAAVAGTPTPNLSKSIADRQRIAADLYRAKPYGGRIYLFKAESEMEFFGGGPELGWKGILSDPVIYLVPGDHGTINTGNNLRILAQKLASWLQ
jgi:amino acid adenylation domain-containing protein